MVAISTKVEQHPDIEVLEEWVAAGRPHLGEVGAVAAAVAETEGILARKYEGMLLDEREKNREMFELGVKEGRAQAYRDSARTGFPVFEMLDEAKDKDARAKEATEV